MQIRLKVLKSWLEYKNDYEVSLKKDHTIFKKEENRAGGHFPFTHMKTL